MIERDPYYSLTEVSNSDLSWLEEKLMKPEDAYDRTQAYRFGTLLDCMITEAEKINYFKFTCAGDQYTPDEFKLAEEMKAAYWKDQFCAMITKHSQMQSVVRDPRFEIQHEGLRFWLAVRLKYDLDARKILNMTGDIKSTTATTEKQFIDACHHFQYFRQRAWYMDIGKSDKDMLIGVSKVNKKVFKVPIVRGGELYNIGKQQYQRLAWMWKYLFEDLDDVVQMDLPQLKIAV